MSMSVPHTTHPKKDLNNTLQDIKRIATYANMARGFVLGYTGTTKDSNHERLRKKRKNVLQLASESAVMPSGKINAIITQRKYEYLNGK